MESFKDFFSGNVVGKIASSDLPAKDKSRLIKLKMWMSAFGYLCGVVGISALGIMVNGAYQDRLVDIDTAVADASIQNEFLASATEIQLEYLDRYSKYDISQRYYFLDMMRFTAPGEETRMQYDSMFQHFDLYEGQIVRELNKQKLKSIAEQKNAEGHAKIEKAKDPNSTLSLAEKNVLITAGEALLAEGDVKEQYIDDLEDKEKEEAEKLDESTFTDLAAQAGEKGWEKTVTEKKSYNSRAFIEWFEQGKLKVAMLDIKSGEAVVRITWGEKPYEKPYLHNERFTLKMNKEKNFTMNERKYTITLVNVYETRTRWNATYDIKYIPE